MDEQAATDIFDAYLARHAEEIGIALARMPLPAKRLSAGWAFYWQSRDYVETRDFGTMLVGHGPVVIRDDGTLIQGGSLDHDPEVLLTTGPVVKSPRTAPRG